MRLPGMPSVEIVFAALLLSSASIAASAANLANGERINGVCAFCHGMFGQGTPSMLAPRLADLPEWYLRKAIGDFKNHVRMDPLMMRTTGMDKMSESDIEDISAYLSTIGLSQDPAFNIEMRTGSVEAGEDLFMDDCKTCHGKDGFGIERKDAPPLAGQQHEYLQSTIELFKERKRHHDNDPEDETFDDYSPQDLTDILAFVATLDNQRFKPGFRFEPAVARKKPTPEADRPTAFDNSVMQIVDIRQTMAKMPISSTVTVDEAISAMRSRAYDLNLRVVGEQHISSEQRSRGINARYLTVLQFCSPSDSHTLINANPIFAGYMPCRIAIVEDAQSKLWLVMFNLDIMVDSSLLPPDVVETAVRINRSMLSIMASGATGEF
ncbi:MAG: c-type cytochrome [Chromatiaceae bacterium]|nr:c-type cytochrome [Gammaproteobacteria bacterium]MCP5304938.1 c-type cytochrome [Chromatiaceae bacterium]MCP5314897.1 c-type cytochrome [Chromatiaceae bacterium]